MAPERPFKRRSRDFYVTALQWQDFWLGFIFG
jgi:hypothetical protein